MILLIFYWLLLLMVSLGIGLLIVSGDDRERVLREDRLIVSIWAGLTLVALLLLVFSLFLPLRRLPTLTIVVSCGLLPYLTSRVQRQLAGFMQTLTLSSLVWWAVPVIFLGIFCSQELTFFDTGLYHHQMSLMQEKYGTLRGAALIHNRFGFTSTWFSLAALFPAQTLGGFCVLLGAIHLTLVLRRILGGEARFSDWFAASGYLLAFPYLLLAAGLAVSPSPDVPMALLTIVIVWWILAVRNDPSERLTILFLGLMAFSIKLSSLPILLLVFLNCVIGRSFDWRRWLMATLLSLGLILPVLSANIITSGCPLYPSGIGCIESLPWAVRAVDAERLRMISTDFSRSEGRGGIVPPFPEWFRDWMFDDFTGSLSNSSFLLLVSILSLAAFVVMGRGSLPYYDYWLAIGIGLAGILYVVALAPSLRFGLGYFVILPALALARGRWRTLILVPLISTAVPLLTPYTELGSRKYRLLLIGLVTIAYLGSLIYRRLQNEWLFRLTLAAAVLSPMISIFQIQPDRQGFLFPATIRQPPPSSLKALNQDGFTLNLTEYGPLRNQCWAAPFPCTPDQPRIPLRTLDPRRGIGGGVGMIKEQSEH